MVYLFPKKKVPPKASTDIPTGLDLIREEENLPTVIQGRPVQSLEEARIAVGLEVIGWRFIYQEAFYGGRTTAGGIVVDFLVLTPGAATPLLMQSRYWHTIRDRRAKDIYQISRLMSIPNLANPIEIWDYEVQSLEQTIRVLMNRLGGA